jgi:hypothetical protein
MSDERADVRTIATTLNRVALLLSLAIFLAIGMWWWRDRTRHYETPRWEAARFVMLRPPVPAAGPAWMVAVNPECSHCRARLADLLRRGSARAAGAGLGVLLVDTPHRPDSLDDGDRLEAGVWWDSLGVWRARWGHRVYGETMVFSGDGTLVRVIRPESAPEDSMPR